jgi:hypothetical protein
VTLEPILEPEPTPWSTGLIVSAISAALAAVAVFAFGIALARIHPVLAVIINIVAAGGSAPTLWGWRNLQTYRWVVYGAVVGICFGWIGLLFTAL